MKDASLLRRSGRVAGALAVAALAGCADLGDVRGPANVILPAHIGKIGLRTFENKTQYFGLEDRFRLKVEQEMIRDGRLAFSGTESDADGIVQGEIVNYIPQVVTYDANNQVLEYRLWVIINVSFLDRKENRVLWEEPRLEQSYRYFVETQVGGMTEEEARERVWDLFARDIVKRVVEGYGSVTGASEKKVPEKPLPPQDILLPPPVDGSRSAPPSPYN